MADDIEELGDQAIEHNVITADLHLRDLGPPVGHARDKHQQSTDWQNFPAAVSFGVMLRASQGRPRYAGRSTSY